MLINGNRFLDGILDMMRHEIRGHVLERLAVDPSTPIEGLQYYNTGTKRIRTYNGTTWDEMGGLGTLTGLIKATGGVPSVAVANTDYLPVNNPVMTGAPAAPTAAPGTSTTQLSTTAFVAAAVAGVVAAADALVFKGGIDCSANPNYPAADAGWTYRVTVAGKIGGAGGVNVQVGDSFTCAVDGTAGGNQATVGANWFIVQTNLEAATTGSPGFVQLATQAEADAHTDAVKVVTPLALATHTRKVVGTFGDGAATSFVLTHNLGNKAVEVGIRNTATDFVEQPGEILMSTTNNVTISGWTVPPGVGVYTYWIIG